MRQYIFVVLICISLVVSNVEVNPPSFQFLSIVLPDLELSVLPRPYICSVHPPFLSEVLRLQCESHLVYDHSYATSLDSYFRWEIHMAFPLLKSSYLCTNRTHLKVLLSQCKILNLLHTD